jgi:hypothetical protein
VDVASLLPSSQFTIQQLLREAWLHVLSPARATTD